MSGKKRAQTEDEWQEEMAGKILSYLQNEIYMDFRFLEIALTSFQFQSQEGLLTFATDGMIIYYPKSWLLRLFQTNTLFLDRAYLHTVLHCIFSHLWTGTGLLREEWHLACDIAVEYVIDHMNGNCTRRILSFIRKEIYEELEENCQMIAAYPIYLFLQDKDSEYLNKLYQEFFTDDHRFWPKEEKTQGVKMPSAAKKKWDKIAKQTMLQQKSQNSDKKDGMTSFQNNIKAERGRRSYREFLKKFMVIREEMRCDLDEFDLSYYMYGFRVYGNMPLVEPLESKEEKKVRDFVIVLDTSYSTSGELVRSFLEETFRLLCEQNIFFQHVKIHIIQCDEEVREDHVLTEQELQNIAVFLEQFQILGGGGTDFRPAFAYIDELLLEGKFDELCGVLYFTDGKGIYPNHAPNYKTAFLFIEEFDREKVPAWAICEKLEPLEFRKGEQYEYTGSKK